MKKYLLDTQILIWFYENNPQLSETVKEIIVNGEHKLYFSVASLWEMTIKIGKGNLILSNPLETWLSQIESDEIEILLVQPHHILSLPSLPLAHRDPFDRIIIAQARTEELTLISSDRIFEEYPILLIKNE